MSFELNNQNEFVSDVAPCMTWLDFPEKMPIHSDKLYVAECNNGFISVCYWLQPKGSWKCFYSLGLSKPLRGVVRWLEVGPLMHHDENNETNWEDYEVKQPLSDDGLYVTYSPNGFITVCRWDDGYQSFRNICNTRNIDSVSKWTMLPRSTYSKLIVAPLAEKPVRNSWLNRIRHKISIWSNLFHPQVFVSNQ